MTNVDELSASIDTSLKEALAANFMRVARLLRSAKEERPEDFPKLLEKYRIGKRRERHELAAVDLP